MTIIFALLLNLYIFLIAVSEYRYHADASPIIFTLSLHFLNKSVIQRGYLQNLDWQNHKKNN